MDDSALALAQRPPKMGETIGLQEHRYLRRVGLLRLEWLSLSFPQTSPLKSNLSKCATNNLRKIIPVTTSASMSSKCLRSQHSLIMSDFISGTSLSIAEMSPLITPRMTPPRRLLPSTPRSSSTPLSQIGASYAHWHTGYLEFIFANICQPAEPTLTSPAMKGLDLQLADGWNSVFRTNV